METGYLQICLLFLYFFGDVLCSSAISGRRYTLFPGLRRWNEVQNVCRKYGLGMLKIESKSEMSVFVQFVKKWRQTQKITNDIWTGLHDEDIKKNNSEYHWEDCTPLGRYRPWYANEPNGHGFENCVRTTPEGLLRTRQCYKSYHTICQEKMDECWKEESLDGNPRLHNCSCIRKCGILRSFRGCNSTDKDDICHSIVEAFSAGSHKRTCHAGHYSAEKPAVKTNIRSIGKCLKIAFTRKPTTAECLVSRDTQPVSSTSTLILNSTAIKTTTSTTQVGSNLQSATSSSVGDTISLLSTLPRTTKVTVASFTTHAAIAASPGTTSSSAMIAASTFASTRTDVIVSGTTAIVSGNLSANVADTAINVKSSQKESTSEITRTEKRPKLDSITDIMISGTFMISTPTITALQQDETATDTMILGFDIKATPTVTAISTTLAATYTYELIPTAAIDTVANASMELLPAKLPTPSTVQHISVTSAYMEEGQGRKKSMKPIHDRICGRSDTGHTCVCIPKGNVSKRVEHIKRFPVVKKILSSYNRSKTSAPDHRPSAVIIGTSGIFLLAFVLGVPVLMDIHTFVLWLQRLLKK